MGPSGPRCDRRFVQTCENRRPRLDVGGYDSGSGAGLNSAGSSDAPRSPSDTAPARSPHATGYRQRLRQHMPPERDRLTYTLALSLLVHALLLRLTFGGLPGFSFPWQDRLIQVPD